MQTHCFISCCVSSFSALTLGSLYPGGVPSGPWVSQSFSPLCFLLDSLLSKHRHKEPPRRPRTVLFTQYNTMPQIRGPPNSFRTTAARQGPYYDRASLKVLTLFSLSPAPCSFADSRPLCPQATGPGPRRPHLERGPGQLDAAGPGSSGPGDAGLL